MKPVRLWISCLVVSFTLGLSHADKDQAKTDGRAITAKPLTEKQKKKREEKLRKELETPYKKWLSEDVAYIITDGERQAFKGLNTDDEREQFIEQFWLRRDPTPDTDDNEFKQEHYRRMAYANERLYWNEGYREKRPLLTPLQTEPPDIDRYLAEHRELGLSLYDSHSDGSGCCYSSRLRPILNMRPKYRAWRLHDAKSANGTRVDGAAATPGADGLEVRSGAVVSFGSLTCEVVTSGDLYDVL